jgi:alpha-N-arabinofuranosidase
VAALNFNIFHRHADRVRLAAIAQMVNVLQAMILTRDARMILTPTYHVFRLFRPFQDATSLPADLQTPAYSLGNISVPAISMSAARGVDNAIIVALVNLDPKAPIAFSAVVMGAQPKQVRGDVLTASSMDARNTFESPDAVHPTAFTGASLKAGTFSLTLPAKSVVVLRLE